MKIRILKLTPESLAKLFQGETTTFTANLPRDIEILDIKMDLFTKQVSMVIRSESFEDIAENISPPEIQLSKSIELKSPSKPATTVKPQTVTETKSMVAKMPQPQPSRMALKWKMGLVPINASFLVSLQKRIV